METNNTEIMRYAQMFGLYDLNVKDDLQTAKSEKILATRREENMTKEVMKFLFGSIELTSLQTTDNDDNILQLVERVNRFSDANPGYPHLAAICVYPRFVELVSQSLEVEGIELTTVTGGFPSSQTFAEIKTIETSLAIKDGATEIDIVLPVGSFLAGDYEEVNSQISEIKAICSETPLKVILETGALMSQKNIKKAALMAIYSGADYIKTSTGKLHPDATPEAVLTMCETIKEYYQKTGTQIGLKIAGGVRTAEEAVGYYTIVKETLGEPWLNNRLFRIGASSLANNLLSTIEGKEIKAF